MNELIVLATIGFITTVGYTIIRGFNLLSSKENLFAIACSYGLGVGLITSQLYLYSRMQVPWMVEYIFTPWLLIIGWIVIKKRKDIVFSLPKFTSLRLVDTLLIIGIILTVGYVVFEALIRPVTVWDGWAIWLMKSKIFFIDGMINPEILNYVRSDYPLIVSLLGTFVYLVLGHVNDTAVLLTSVAFYIFLGLAIFAAIKNEYGLTYALLFTFLFVTLQNFVRHGGRLEAGQADLPLGYYTFMCTMLLIEYIRKSNSKVLLLLSSFLGITCLIKFEGIPISLVIVGFLLYHIYKHKLYRHIIFLLFWFIPFIDWQIYKKMYHLSYTYFSGHTFIFSFGKIVEAFTGTVRELLNVKSWNLLWITYFYTFFIAQKKLTYTQFILHAIILSQLLLYLGIYSFTTGNNPESSIQRLLVHIAPLVLYSIAVSVGGLLLKKLRVAFY